MKTLSRHDFYTNRLFFAVRHHAQPQLGQVYVVLGLEVEVGRVADRGAETLALVGPEGDALGEGTHVHLDRVQLLGLQQSARTLAFSVKS